MNQETAQAQQNKEKMHEFVDSMKNRDWPHLILRLACMVAYSFVAWAALFAGFSLSVIQFIIAIITNEPNETIGKMISGIGAFQKQVFSFLSFETDQYPYPFGGDNPFDGI